MANGLLVKLLEHGNRRVTLLGWRYCKNPVLQSELGFQEHEIQRCKGIGYVASEIT